MIITQRSEQGIDVVEISGRLLMADVDEARSSLKTIVTEGNGKLVLDLGQLSFIDSSGCGVLIAALKYIRMREGKIALCALTRNVRALLELTKVIELFSVFPTTDAALEAFADQSGEPKQA